MDVKDSYLHGTVGVVKSISVNADKLSYKLADIAGTVREVTLPVATLTANGLLSKEDKNKLDNMIATRVANDLILKINSGTTEGTSLYTYNGSSAKTLDIKSGTGIGFTNNAGLLQIYNAGVRSIATGTTNGTISVNTNGTSADIAVKGLKSAAYTSSDDYIRLIHIGTVTDPSNLYAKVVNYFGDTRTVIAQLKSEDGLWGHLLLKFLNPTLSTYGVDGSGLFMTGSTFYRWGFTGKDTTEEPLVVNKYKIYDEGNLKVVSSSANGLAPKVINTNTATVGTAYYVLASSDGSAAPSWYKLPANAFANDDTKVTQTNTSTDASYRVLFSGNANDTTETTTARKSTNLKFNPSTGSLSTKIVTIDSNIVITNTNNAKHILFSRGSDTNYPYNYIAAPVGGYICILPDGVSNESTSGMHFTGEGLRPATNAAYSLGTTSLKWNNVYANTFVGSLTGNATTATKLATKRKLWGLDFDGSADVSGSLSDVTNITSQNSAHLVLRTPAESYKYIYLRYNNNDSTSACLTGNGFMPTSASNNKLTLGASDKKWSAVYATTFIGNLDGTYVNTLTGYTKATAISALAATDTLNTALGKLEYKADVAYDLVKGAYDGDGTIENLAEILKVLEGIKDTETILAIVGKYLPLSGGTLSSAEVPLVINRKDGNYSSIKYQLNGNVLGFLGFDNYGIAVVSPKRQEGNNQYYALIHSGNISSQSVASADYATNAGDADTLDGVQLNDVAKHIFGAGTYKRLPSGSDLNSIDFGVWGTLDNTSYTNAPQTNFGLIQLGLNTSYRGQLLLGYGEKPLIRYRAQYWKDSVANWSDWRTLAFTDSNVASADYATSAGNADSATKIIVSQHASNEIEYPLVWTNQNNGNNTTANQLYKSYLDLTYNPKHKRITSSIFKGNLQGNIKPFTTISFTSGTSTVKNIKDALVTAFLQISAGVGANVIVPAQAISLWNDETKVIYNSNVYSMIKIGGGYESTAYGLWLLSTYSSNKIGYVGRDTNTWGSIYWLARTIDIPTKLSQLTNDIGFITSDGLDNYVTLNTTQTITGIKNFNTNSGNNPLKISRDGYNSEVVYISVNDSQATFEYTNDEKQNSFVFKMVNTDVENSDGSGNNTSQVTFVGSASGSTIAADTLAGKLNSTLTFSAGAFSAKTYNNNSAVTVNIPTHTSHLTNNSGFLTQHQSLDNYVTLNTALTITGSKTFTASTNTFSGTSASILTIDRNSTNPAWIKFCKNGTLQGYIGITNDFQPVFLSGESGAGNKIILHSGNYTDYINTTNFPGLNKTGTVTSIKVGSTSYSPSSGVVSLPAYPTSLKNPNAIKFKNTAGTEVSYDGSTAVDLTGGIYSAKQLTQVLFTSGLDLNTIKTEQVYVNTLTSVCSSLLNGPSGRSNGEIRLESVNCGSDTYGFLTLYTRSSNTYEIWYRTWANSDFTSWVKNIHSGNYTAYTVKKDGTGASGTWDINISGNANSATTATRSNYLETLKQDGSGWYGDQYKLYALWGSSTILDLKCDGYSTRVNLAKTLDSITAISAKAFSLSNASWTDTGYTFASLTSGTYAIQITSGSNLVASGIMSVYKNLSDTAGDEIPLHVYGTAGWRPYLRTYDNKLLISSNDVSATSRTVTIKIAQIL